MPRDILLPGKQTTGYKLLELTAISGELPANQLSRLSGGESYKASVITALKQKSCSQPITGTVCGDTG